MVKCSLCIDNYNSFLQFDLQERSKWLFNNKLCYGCVSAISVNQNASYYKNRNECKVRKDTRPLSMVLLIDKSNYEKVSFKKEVNISNNPEIIKLYKNQRNYVVNLSRKVKKEYFQKHMPHGISCQNFGNFENYSYQIKEQILTTELYRRKKEK